MLSRKSPIFGKKDPIITPTVTRVEVESTLPAETPALAEQVRDLEARVKELEKLTLPLQAFNY